MLIKKELSDKMMEQVGNEFGAAAQYLAIAVYFEQESMENTAGFFYTQSEEERQHGLKLLKYVVDAGGEVVIPSVAAPTMKISSAEEAFQMSLNWELEVTDQINGLMEMAVQQKDYMAQGFLTWFVNEQLEEVTTMEKYLGLIRKMGDRNIFFLENIISHPEAAGAAE